MRYSICWLNSTYNQKCWVYISNCHSFHWIYRCLDKLYRVKSARENTRLFLFWLFEPVDELGRLIDEVVKMALAMRLADLEKRIRWSEKTLLTTCSSRLIFSRLYYSEHFASSSQSDNSKRARIIELVQMHFGLGLEHHKKTIVWDFRLILVNSETFHEILAEEAS